MPPQGPSASAGSAGLLLLATEQKVHAYDLSEFSRVGIGRHRSNEIQLASRTVSNFHAEILKEDGGLVVRDLGSTNGTSVNGEKVDRARLSPGDSIRIGNHVLSLQLQAALDSGIAASGGHSPNALGPGARGKILGGKPRAIDGFPAPPADSGDMPLSELLRRIAVLHEPLQAVVERDRERARVLFHRHRLIHAELGSAVGEKALYRLFSWQHASYQIEALPNPGQAPVSVCVPLDALVVEGLDHALELGKLVANLPPLATPLRLNENCPLPLTAHTPAEIEIFQAVIRHETIERVLEKSPWTDVRVLRLIDSLMRKSVFDVSPLEGMDETSNLVPLIRKGDEEMEEMG